MNRVTCVAFTGHRDRITRESVLRAIEKRYPGALWLTGGSEGFDHQVEEYADLHGIRWERVRPEYDRYPPQVAPLKRNEAMVDRAGGAGGLLRRSGPGRDVPGDALRAPLPGGGGHGGSC